MTPTERILSQIKAAQKLSEGATPGPWEVYARQYVSRGEKRQGKPRVSGFNAWNERQGEEQQDAHFIAASREGWPRTLRQLEEAVKALTAMEMLIDAAPYNFETDDRSWTPWEREWLAVFRASLSRIAALAEEK